MVLITLPESNDSSVLVLSESEVFLVIAPCSIENPVVLELALIKQKA